MPLDAAFKQYQYTAGMNLQGNVAFDAQGFINRLVALAQVNEAEGWVSGLDNAFIQNTLTIYQDQVNAYITAQKADATVGDVLGTKRIITVPRPVLALGLPYAVVVRGNVFAQIPENLRHKFQFSLYATALDRLLDAPVLRLTQSLPTLADKKLTLSFAPASQADTDLISSYLPPPPADGSLGSPNALPTALPGYLIRVVGELRVNSAVVVRGGTFTMGQVLLSTVGLYDPSSGWQEIENTPPVAGEYRALAMDAAGIAASQLQAVSKELTTAKARLEAGQLTDLMADNVSGNLLYSTVLSYFAVNDVTARLSASVAGVVEYRRPSFGSFTAKVQPHFVFGIPRTVSFPGLELDITHSDSVVVSKANDRAAQVAYVQLRGVRQSAFEHQIPERLFTTAQRLGEAVSAVKALAVASSQGQRIYTITQDNLASVLPQLDVDPDVQAEIQAAVATGKHALVSQRNITVSGWTGVGYILLDPETGAGAYQISGGANGSFLFGATLTSLVLLFFVAIITQNIFLLAAAIIAIGSTLVVYKEFENVGFDPGDDIHKACFFQGVGALFALLGTVTAFRIVPLPVQAKVNELLARITAILGDILLFQYTDPAQTCF